MRVSVLVVNHNGERHLERCLSSLGPAALDPRAAEAEHVEVLLADNGSQDGSLALVHRRFPGVRVLELGENLGFGAANNRAAAAATGDALLLLNNDAWLAEGCLDGLLGRLIQEPAAALVAPRLRYPDGRLQISWAPGVSLFGEALRRLTNRFEGKALLHGPVRRLLRALTGGGWYSAACALVRREVFEQVAGFDEGFFLYFEDVDLCLRLRQAGWKLAEERSSTAFHQGGGSWRAPSDVSESPAAAAAGRAAVEYRRSQLRFYRLHRPSWEGRWLRWYLKRKCKQIGDLDTREQVLAAIAADAGQG